MDNNEEKVLLNGQPIDEPEIFGRSKSRDEIKAETKEQRKRELAALRDARRLARAENRADLAAHKGDLIFLFVALGVVVLFGAIMLAVSISNAEKQELYEISETVSGYFYDEEAKPTLEEDGITAAVNELYYTKGGHLCVNMTLGNGTKKDMSLDSLEVKIYNEKDALVASGYTENIDDSYIVPAGENNDYTLYIKPEHVKISNDSLTTISYEVTAVGTELEE